MIDISSCGALVEGDARLLPGTHLDVHVVTRIGRSLVRSCVTRAWVAELRPDRVLYRAALASEPIVDLGAARSTGEQVASGNAIPSAGAGQPHDSGTPYPAHAP